MFAFTCFLHTLSQIIITNSYLTSDRQMHGRTGRKQCTRVSCGFARKGMSEKSIILKMQTEYHNKNSFFFCIFLYYGVAHSVSRLNFSPYHLDNGTSNASSLLNSFTLRSVGKYSGNSTLQVLSKKTKPAMYNEQKAFFRHTAIDMALLFHKGSRFQTVDKKCTNYDISGLLAGLLYQIVYLL